jgi:hypothetical protein
VAENRRRSQLSVLTVIIKLSRSKRAFAALVNVLLYGSVGNFGDCNNHLNSSTAYFSPQWSPHYLCDYKTYMATLLSKLGSCMLLRTFQQYSVSLAPVFDALFTFDSYCHCGMDCGQNGTPMDDTVVLDRWYPVVDRNGIQGENCFVRDRLCSC